MPWLKKLYLKRGWDPLPNQQKSAFMQRRYQRKLEEIQKQLSPSSASLFFPEGRSQLYTPLTESPDQKILAEISKGTDAEIIYAHVEGMLGSLFSSRSFGGPQAGRLSMGRIVWLLLKNCLFFMPKRKVTIVFSKQPLFTKENEPHFIPHFRGEQPPFRESSEEQLSAIQDQVFTKLAQLSGKKRQKIHPDQNLYEDLQLDSLDVTELTVWTREAFDRYIPFDRLVTVQDILDGIVRYRPTDREALHEKQHAAWIRERKKAFAPKEPTEKTILEAFFAICDRMGSEIACADPTEFMSYKRLKSAVVGMAEPFKKLPGKQIGILLNNSVQFNVIYLALLLAGKTPALLNWTLGPKHLESAAELASLSGIITSGPFLEHLQLELSPELEQKVYLFNDILYSLSSKQKQASLELARKEGAQILRHFGNKRDPEETAVLLFTSGTEGLPKGVPLSHRNLLANLSSQTRALDFTEKDVLFGILPAFHAYGFSVGNLLPLLIGCRGIYMPNILDFEQNAELIQNWGATVLITTPTFLSALLKIASPEQIQTTRLYIVGAEKAPDPLFDKVTELPQKPLLVEGYGVTECSPCLTLNALSNQREGVGFPLPGVELLIVDPHTLQILPEGKSGLILAHGDNVFKGYLHKRKQPFVHLRNKNWYNTQDLGRVQQNGALILEGRLSRTIKIGGELVHLQALESILQVEFPAAALALVAKEGNGKTVLTLFCTQEIELERVNRSLKEAGMSNLLRVHDVHFLKEMPRLGNGKINYKSLQSD